MCDIPSDIPDSIVMAAIAGDEDKEKIELAFENFSKGHLHELLALPSSRFGWNKWSLRDAFEVGWCSGRKESLAKHQATVREIKAKVLAIQQHHSKPRQERHGSTSGICEEILSMIESITPKSEK